MSEPKPDPRDVETRPISVAELLAKNGTIGAPPVTGRRRRRRGNADAVTVAELTGEIPIIRDEDPAEADGEVMPSSMPDDAVSGAQPAATMLGGPAPGFVEDERPMTGPSPVQRPQPVARPGDDAAQRWPADSSPQAPRDRGPERSAYPRPQRRSATPTAASRVEPAPQSAGSGAEQMCPDPVDNYFAVDVEAIGVGMRAAVLPTEDSAFVRSVLSGKGAQSDALERPADPVLDPDTANDSDDQAAAPDDDSAQTYLGRPGLVGGAVVVLQSIMAVAFGGGLFIAFDQLWRWNSIVALVLTVLVTLGLVAAVQAVRKTSDIVSTLTAVAVGLLVTLGPLVLNAA